MRKPSALLIIIFAILSLSLWDAFGLEPKMYYRQCGMFVGYLRRMDGGEKFRTFMLSLYKGDEFGKAFESAFGTTVEKSWDVYVGGLGR